MFEFLMIVLVIIAIVAVIREIVCWYWKINSLVSLMEKQHELHERMAGNLAAITKVLAPEALPAAAPEPERATNQLFLSVPVPTATMPDDDAPA